MRKKKTNGTSEALETARDCIERRDAKRHRTVSDFFNQLARRCADALGSAWAFAIAVLVVVTWAATGPVFAYSDTWQLAVNTGTTIVTFLMVFLIQNAQNRDAKAFHLKLDELILKLHGARNRLIALEDLNDAELEELHAAFHRLATTRTAPGGKSRQESRSEQARRTAN